MTQITILVFLLISIQHVVH